MSARSKARKRALDILYQSDVRGVSPVDVLQVEEGRRLERREAELNPLVRELVGGVSEHRVEIDEILATYSLGWTVERMAAVDRAALRIGVYEVIWADEVPDAVAISEAVALVSDLSTDESPSFVNGLLSRASEMKSLHR